MRFLEMIYFHLMKNKRNKKIRFAVCNNSLYNDNFRSLERTPFEMFTIDIDETLKVILNLSLQFIPFSIY